MEIEMESKVKIVKRQNIDVYNDIPLRLKLLK